MERKVITQSNEWTILVFADIESESIINHRIKISQAGESIILQPQKITEMINILTEINETYGNQTKNT